MDKNREAVKINKQELNGVQNVINADVRQLDLVQQRPNQNDVIQYYNNKLEQLETREMELLERGRKFEEDEETIKNQDLFSVVVESRYRFSKYPHGH